MKTLIVSRFNEDLDWLYKVKDWKIALYNKGQDINLDCIKLPNVGREAETYLNFIVNNYDTLKGIYAFFQGYPYGHGLSNNENIISDLESINENLGFQFFKNSRILYCDHRGLPDHDTGLNIKDYVSKYNIKIPEVLTFSPGAQFVVKAENIKLRDKTFYINLLNSVNYDIKPVESYILERLWKYIFENE